MNLTKYNLLFNSKMIRITEQSSTHRHLEKMSVEEITQRINAEDKTVPNAIEKALPQLNKLIKVSVEQIKNEGRLFYIGAGSGGRLSVLDVIELPTTYGIRKGLVNVVLAGGVDHLIEALEEKEDDIHAGWEMLQQYQLTTKDIVIGISASGSTPFVLAALKKCRENKIVTGCIVSNPDSPIAGQADFPVEVITGPEFITGSTRMKCGTAQKMIFDMISTTVMIQLGRVEDNHMVNMKLLNDKMVDRSVRMVLSKSTLADFDKAKEILLEKGSVRAALDHIGSKDINQINK